MKAEGKSISHPLIEAYVEVTIDPSSNAILVIPRDTEPQVYLQPFSELDSSAVPRLRNLAQTHFEKLNSDTSDGLSPFEANTFEPILRYAVSLLSGEAKYYPDISPDPNDRTLPEITEELTVTDTWAIYARPRSSNDIAQDIDRLRKEIIKQEEQHLPGPSTSLVDPKSDLLRQRAGPGLTGRLGAAKNGPGMT